MDIKFKVYTTGIDSIRHRLIQACTKAEHIVAEQVRKDTRPFVPKSGTEGGSHLDNRTQVRGNFIIYPGPYARFLYFGKVMIDPETGSTVAPKDGIKVVTDRNLIFRTSPHQQATSHWFEVSKAQNKDKWLRVAEKAVKHEFD